MLSSNTIKSATAGQTKVENGMEEGAVLAAVLAAALVEYGERLEGRTGTGDKQDARSNWQTLACLERLQGRA